MGYPRGSCRRGQAESNQLPASSDSSQITRGKPSRTRKTTSSATQWISYLGPLRYSSWMVTKEHKINNNVSSKQDFYPLPGHGYRTQLTLHAQHCYSWISPFWKLPLPIIFGIQHQQVLWPWQILCHQELWISSINCPLALIVFSAIKLESIAQSLRLVLFLLHAC